MSYRILMPQYVPMDSLKPLVDLGCTFITDCGSTEKDLCKAIVDCDAVLARMTKYTRRILEAGKQIKIVARYGVGLENIDLKAAEELGIWVSFTPEANMNTVAEHTVGLIISCARHMSFTEREFRKGDFSVRNKMTGEDLEDKTVGILGLGRIGTLVAKKCMLGLGMHVLAYDPYLPVDKVLQGVTLSRDIKHVLNNSDFISMHLPLLPTTKEMMNASLFKEMKDSAYFINTSRGGVVNELDLIEALRDKRIAGAALDVFSKEPPDVQNELFSFPNVTMTPHDASFTYEAYHRMGEHAAECIVDVLDKKKAPHWPANHPRNPRT